MIRSAVAEDTCSRLDQDVYFSTGKTLVSMVIGTRAVLRLVWPFHGTVVPVMNGHPRNQAKVSVHCRLPLVTGTDGQAGGRQIEYTLQYFLLLSPPEIFLMNTRIVIIIYAMVSKPKINST